MTRFAPVQSNPHEKGGRASRPDPLGARWCGQPSAGTGAVQSTVFTQRAKLVAATPKRA